MKNVMLQLNAICLTAFAISCSQAYGQQVQSSLPATGTGSVELNVCDQEQLAIMTEHQQAAASDQIDDGNYVPIWVYQYLNGGRGVTTWQTLSPAQRAWLGLDTLSP
jgi:hypothetical protein